MREMKESDCLWAGIVPVTWTSAPLKSEFTFGKGLPITKENLIEKGLPVISYGQIHSKTCVGTTLSEHLLRYVDERYSVSNPQSRTDFGDIIVADTSEDLNGCGNAVFNDRDYPVYAGYHTIIMHKATDSDTKYYAYLMKTDAWRSQIREQLTDVKLFSISQKVLKSTYLLIPPLSEQSSIVAYLDSRCAKIDEAISRHKQIIEKLEEYRKSVITQAVTKGLNPNVEMKASSCIWAEMIPATWTSAPLKSEFTFGKGLPITKENLIEKGLPVISYGQIHSKTCVGTTLPEHLLRYVDEGYSISNPQSRTDFGDIIVADTSEDLNGCGNAVFNDRDYPVYAGYHTIILHRVTDSDTKYYAYLMKTDAWRSQIREQLTDVKLFSISQKVLKSTYLLVPPLSEQSAIVAYLDSRCAKIDEAVAHHKGVIEKLEEYRKAIICNAVTGKIDCRTAE